MLLFFLPCSLEDSMSHVCWEEQQSHKFLASKRAVSRGVKLYARPSYRPDSQVSVFVYLENVWKYAFVKVSW